MEYEYKAVEFRWYGNGSLAATGKKIIASMAGEKEIGIADIFLDFIKRHAVDGWEYYRLEILDDWIKIAIFRRPKQ